MTMVRMMKSVLLSCGLLFGATLPAQAETPQTDVAFVEQLAALPTQQVLNALTLYYDLHVSEIEVQSMREQNVGAFLAAARARDDGDMAEAQSQTEIFENTKDALDTQRQTNVDLRQTLSEVTGLDFGDDLAMAPDVPDVLPPAPDGVPDDLLKARAAAWGQVEQARTQLSQMRLKLLDDQAEYDRTRQVKLGDTMRAMTRAEATMARAACDLRLNEAKIAASIGWSLAEILSGF